MIRYLLTPLVTSLYHVRAWFTCGCKKCQTARLYMLLCADDETWNDMAFQPYNWSYENA